MDNSKITGKMTVANRQLRLAAIALSIFMGGTASWAGEVTASVTNSNLPDRKILSLNNRVVISEVNFVPPDDQTPNSARGGGSRGNINFVPPDDNTPNSTKGGGSRGEVGFTPINDNKPNSTKGGGSRGELGFIAVENIDPNSSNGNSLDNNHLLRYPAPLLPSNNIGRTVSPRPTIFVYVPQMAVKKVFFFLQSENNQYHYHTTFDLNKTGGIVSFKVPEDAPALEVGKTYHWSVIFIAPGEILHPDARAVTGWVKRVPAPTADSSLSPIQLASLYGKSGIWYDTLDLLSSAHQKAPENSSLLKEWADLLNQVGLTYLTQEPLTQQL
jgi:hypothetical protein